MLFRSLSDPANHVIVMHDAGGNRSETVEALKVLIPKLKSQGYRFIGLPEASGLPAASFNSPLEHSELFFVSVTALVAGILRYGWLIIVWLFFFTTAVAILRILFLGSMVIVSAVNSKRNRVDALPSFPLSVLIPAFNEEKTIGYTLQSLLKSTYQNIEIIVIDDGSTDRTARIVEEISERETRVKLLSKQNGGKSSALNAGMEMASADIVITGDADTIFFPETLSELAKPFLDPNVDAVCGNVEVGNVRNLLTGFQSLEYITTQNFDRRAFDALNCISVVPGATGAWRRKKIMDLGGYLDDTLTEDAELTLRLLEAGGKIVYAPGARSKTEAPETVSALAKQRFRWSFGTFQVLRKNQKEFFHGSLGWVALPNMFLFQILFPILSPIGDLVFLLAIWRGDFGAIFAGYTLFVIMDVLGSLLAFVLEQRPKKLMWLILIQRFFYRQFMYVITYRAIVAMLKGRRYGWNKLDRTGGAGLKN